MLGSLTVEPGIRSHRGKFSGAASPLKIRAAKEPSAGSSASGRKKRNESLRTNQRARLADAPNHSAGKIGQRQKRAGRRGQACPEFRCNGGDLTRARIRKG